MEIDVKISKILEPEKFHSRQATNEWVTKYTFVGQTSGNFPLTVAFVVLKDDVWQGMNIKEGNRYHVFFNPTSKEYNGKYYTNLVAWKVISIDGASQSTNTTSKSMNNDATLPF